MFQIIDCFKVPDKRSSNNLLPSLIMEGSSWFILSHQDEEENSLLPNQIVRITKPDGSVQIVKVVQAQVRHSVLAVQFENIDKTDLPKLSKVEIQDR